MDLQAKSKQLIIIGDSAFAEIAFEYFTYDSEYEVLAFSVERNYLHSQTKFGLPVVPFEELCSIYPPEQVHVYVAVPYTQLNGLRKRLLSESKRLGYLPASYISTRAFVWQNVKIGEHAFIFENNVIQPFVEMGDNCVLWSGNHIGHHSILGHDLFISSHVVISGFCKLGDRSFLGVNATVANNVEIGEQCFIASAATITKPVAACSLVVGLNEVKGDTSRFLR